MTPQPFKPEGEGFILPRPVDDPTKRAADKERDFDDAVFLLRAFGALAGPSLPGSIGELAGITQEDFDEARRRAKEAFRGFAGADPFITEPPMGPFEEGATQLPEPDESGALAQFFGGLAEGGEILGRRLGSSTLAALDFARGGEGFDFEEFHAGLPERLRDDPSLAGGLGQGLGSLGLALSPEEIASDPLAPLFFAAPPGTAAPALAALGGLRQAAGLTAGHAFGALKGAAGRAATSFGRTIDIPSPAQLTRAPTPSFTPQRFGPEALGRTVETAAAAPRAPTVTEQASRLMNFQQPALVRGLEQSRVGRQALDEQQEGVLRQFLQDFGISPFEKTGIAGVDTEPLLGRFVTNPKTGVREFVVGAYENPVARQRFFVMFDTNAKTFDIRTNPGTLTKGRPGVPATGGASIQEIEDSLEAFNRFYGAESRARAAGVRGVVGEEAAEDVEESLLRRFEPKDRFESIQPDPIVEGAAERSRLELQRAGADEVARFVKPALTAEQRAPQRPAAAAVPAGGSGPVRSSMDTPLQAGNTFLGRLRDFGAVANEVVQLSNDTVRELLRKTGIVSAINPSILKAGPTGQAVVAYERQMVAINEMVEVALQAAIDSHTGGASTLRRIAGINPIKIDSDGFVQGTNKLWNDVFSTPSKFNLTDDAMRLIDDVHRLVDEAEAMRVAEGLEPLATRSKEGWFYVPRQATETAAGISLERPSNAKLTRFWEEATDGFAAGVRYDSDVRATVGNHLRAAYREILNAQLSRQLEPLSVAPSELIPQALRDKWVAVTLRRTQAINNVKRLRVPRVERGKGGHVTPAEKELRKSLDDQRAAAKVELDAARTEYNQVRSRYRQALLNARASEQGPGALFGRTDDKIAIKQWRNRFYPADQADELRRAFDGHFGKSNWLAANTGKVLNTIRWLAANVDFAAPFIQGLPAMARQPAAWAKASANHYMAWFDPTIQARYIRQNIETMKEMAQFGVAVGDVEFFTAIQKGGGLSPGALLEFLPKGGSIRQAAQTAGKQTFGRFSASYSTFLGMARAEMWKGMRESWVARGGTLDELAAYINNMTGGLSSRSLGVGPKTRDVEALWLAFSPRLLRSTVALVADGMRGVGPNATLRQRESLRTLLTLVGGVHALHFASGIALGKDLDEIIDGQNPLNGRKYLSHEFNNDWIGVGGQVRAMTQFAANLGSALAPGGKDIETLAQINMRDNPLMAFTASRGAPAVRALSALVEGGSGGSVDALPFEAIDTLPEAFLHIGTSAIPFSIQGRMEGTSAIGTGLEALGLRTTPLSPADVRNKLRKESMDRRGLTGEFKDLGADIRGDIDANPEIIAAQANVEKLNRENKSTVQEYLDANEAINNSVRVDVASLASETGFDQSLRTLTPDAGRALRFGIDTLMAGRSDRKADLRKSPIGVEATQVFEDLDEPSAEFDKALDDYYATVTDPALSLFGEEYDYEERDRRLAALFTDPDAVYSPTMFNQVKAFASRNDPELVRQLRNDREFLQDYFTITRKLADQAGVLELYEQFLESPNKRAFLQTDLPPRRRNNDALVIGKLLQVASDVKAQFRKVKDPEFERLLLRWGWVTAPTNTNLRDEIRATAQAGPPQQFEEAPIQ